MIGTALEYPVSSKAWQLRSAWATGLRVSVTVDAIDVQRIEGHVLAISATDAYVRIGGRQVPLDLVLAVHRPSRLGDSKYRGCPLHAIADDACERCQKAPAWRGGVPTVLGHHPGQLQMGLA